MIRGMHIVCKFSDEKMWIVISPQVNTEAANLSVADLLRPLEEVFA